MKKNPESTPDLKIGDRVIRNRKYYIPEKDIGRVYIVRSKPFDVCGTMCVLLDGGPGGFAVDGLTRI